MVQNIGGGYWRRYPELQGVYTRFTILKIFIQYFSCILYFLTLTKLTFFFHPGNTKTNKDSLNLGWCPTIKSAFSWTSAKVFQTFFSTWQSVALNNMYKWQKHRVMNKKPNGKEVQLVYLESKLKKTYLSCLLPIKLVSFPPACMKEV